MFDRFCVAACYIRWETPCVAQYHKSHGVDWHVMANTIIHEYWNELVCTTNGQLLLLATVYGLLLFLFVCVFFVCLFVC